MKRNPPRENAIAKVDDHGVDFPQEIEMMRELTDPEFMVKEVSDEQMKDIKSESSIRFPKLYYNYSRVNCYGEKLLRRWGLFQVVSQRLDLHFGRLQCNTFGKVSFDVLEEGLQRGLCQLVEVHVAEVGAHFILHSVLLIDEDGLQQGHPVMVGFPLGPTGAVNRSRQSNGSHEYQTSHSPLSNVDAQVISGSGGEPGVTFQYRRINSP